MELSVIKDLGMNFSFRQGTYCIRLYEKLMSMEPTGGTLMEKTDGLTLDFTGTTISIVNFPPELAALMKNSKFNLRIDNEPEFCDKLKVFCILEGIDPDRVLCTIAEKPREITAKEKRVQEEIESIVRDYTEIVVENGQRYGKVFIADKFQSLYSIKSIEYIKGAVKELCKKHSNLHGVILDCKDMIIAESLIRYIVEADIELRQQGIKIILDTSNKDIVRSYGLAYHTLTAASLTEKEKVDKFRQYFNEHSPVLFVSYEGSKSMNIFGQCGDGKVKSCRPAIIKGIFTKDDKWYIRLKYFHIDKFFTREHLAIESEDGYYEDEPEGQDTTLHIDDVGLCTEFMGSKHHILRPLQLDGTGYTTMYSVGENGKINKESLTIPERMLRVFDDYNIDCNREELVKACEETRHILGGA